MNYVRPEVFIIASPQINWSGVAEYLEEVGGSSWYETKLRDIYNVDGQDLVEFAGRMCYRSWEPGLNPNVTRIREDQDLYLDNILRSGHGSVLEHANWTFVFRNVSRVLTHELIRHRVGIAISQESGRYIRQEGEIPFWVPDWVLEDQELVDHILDQLAIMEGFQTWMTNHFNLDSDGVPFKEKKHKTSFMRRLLPNGMANDITWTANARTIRHTIETRTDPGAEEEIRYLFGKVAEAMVEEAPLLFQDFTELEDGTWVSQNRKV